MDKQNQEDEMFEVCGETFSRKHFPRIHYMYATNPKALESGLRSIADAWHEGSIVSAAQAFESDLAHG